RPTLVPYTTLFRSQYTAAEHRRSTGFRHNAQTALHAGILRGTGARGGARFGLPEDTGLLAGPTTRNAPRRRGARPPARVGAARSRAVRELAGRGQRDRRAGSAGGARARRARI